MRKLLKDEKVVVYFITASRLRNGKHQIWKEFMDVWETKNGDIILTSTTKTPVITMYEKELGLTFYNHPFKLKVRMGKDYFDRIKEGEGVYYYKSTESIVDKFISFDLQSLLKEHSTSDLQFDKKVLDVLKNTDVII